MFIAQEIIHERIQLMDAAQLHHHPFGLSLQVWAIPAPTGMLESVDMVSNGPESPIHEVIPAHGPHHIMYAPNPVMEELVDMLRHELGIRNQEINRLHEVIAQQAQTIERTVALLPATISSISKKPCGWEDVQQKDPTKPDQSGVWERIRKWIDGSDVS